METEYHINMIFFNCINRILVNAHINRFLFLLFFFQKPVYIRELSHFGGMTLARMSICKPLEADELE